MTFRGRSLRIIVPGSSSGNGRNAQQSAEFTQQEYVVIQLFYQEMVKRTEP
jgi:hypothetical protein